MTEPIQPDALPRFTFVLGMHRSGSSALARVLNLAGLRISRQLLAANQDNPSGYWEPQRIVRFNDGLLEALDRHWADPKPMPEGWIDRAVDAHGPADALSLLLEEAAQARGRGAGMVIKDPRLSRLLPLWRQGLAVRGVEPTCLITCRHPLDIARSLQARDRLQQDHALELWLSYMLEAELGTRGMVRRVVHYETLLADWQKTLGGLEDVVVGIDPRGRDRARVAIDAFLDAGLRHHRSAPAELCADNPRHGLVLAAHEAFLAADSPARAQRLDAIDRLRRERWALRSPGLGGSGVTRQMPAWHAEQSAKLVQAGDYRAALEALDVAISLAPDIARFHHLRGKALGQLGDWSAAVEAHRLAVALDASVPRFHRAICDALEKARRFEEAVQALGVLTELRPDAPTHHQHGRWLARVARHAEAADAQRRAIALDGTQAAFHLALSTALMHLNRRDEAAECLSRAIVCDSASPTLHDRLGELHAGADRWPQAAEAYEEAVRLRCLRLGFRVVAPEAPAPPTERADARNQLLCLLARLGARHWAADLTRQLQQRSPALVDSDQAWPLTSSVQLRPIVPIIDVADAPDGTAPLLSIMIPVYGVARESWLRECLDSVLRQDQGPDWAEIVVVDDASHDDSAQRVCELYGGRVRCLRNERNLGLIGNHNHCLSIARGTFVHFLHQDDFVEPGFYDALLGPLAADAQWVAGFTHNRFVDADSRVLSNADAPRPPRGALQDWHIRLSLETRIQFPTIIVRRSTYQQVGGFLPARRFSFDWDLWNRVAASGPVWYEPRPLAAYRMHPASATYTFSLKDRVVDAMQTVAAMVQLLPCQRWRATAEMGMYKFMRRYWGLATDVPFAELDAERTALMALLLQGWAQADDVERVRALLRALC